jgi:hypothetical protein
MLENFLHDLRQRLDQDDYPYRTMTPAEAAEFEILPIRELEE